MNLVNVYFRFRHAVVSAMTGSHRPHKRAMADVVQTQMRLNKAVKEGKIPEGLLYIIIFTCSENGQVHSC